MNSSRERRNDYLLTIFLYEEPSSTTLHLQGIKTFLERTLGNVDVSIRGDFLTYHLHSGSVEEWAKKFASCKVRDLVHPEITMDPLPGEIRFERKLIECPKERISGVLYDGYRLDAVLQKLIPRAEQDFCIIHIVFTNRLFGTFDEGDRRYHARVILCGYPSLISTTGIVEAPAKPKEFYYLKQYSSMVGMRPPLEVLKKEFHGSFIDYDDLRLTEIMKGYVMQSVFYHITYEPFCEKKNCRLYNAHWQEEVLHAQMSGKGFCKKHEQILEKMREEN